jgi:hypothetical protein
LIPSTLEIVWLPKVIGEDPSFKLRGRKRVALEYLSPQVSSDLHRRGSSSRAHFVINHDARGIAEAFGAHVAALAISSQ